MEYYSHLCACGCGNKIEIKEYHKWGGVPLYIHGHNKGNLGKQATEETKQKMKEAKIGYIPWSKGKNLTEKHKEKIRFSKIGKKRTEEAKQKTSETLKENYRIGKMIPWNKGKEAWNKGKKMPELSKKYKGKGNPMYGKAREFSGNWCGGKSLEDYNFEFNKELKDEVKKRDMNVCQTPNCMNISCLDVHHIDYDKTNNNPENLITLCHSCHAKTNGKKKREYFTKFYSEIVSIYL